MTITRQTLTAHIAAAIWVLAVVIVPSLALATCAEEPVAAAPAPPPALVMRNMVGKVVEGGTYRSVYLYRCLGCAVRNATITPPPGASINEQAVRVVQSSGAVIDSLTIIGKPATTGVAITAAQRDKSGNVIGLPTGEGIYVQGSRGVQLIGNAVEGFHQGITFSASPDLAIVGNVIRMVRTSPIAGAARDGLNISGNTLSDSRAWQWGKTPLGDHGDAIHVWTDAGTVRGLKIVGNSFEQGSGSPIMGIFLQAKAGGFTDATVSRNIVATCNGQGIVLNAVSGIAADNTLVDVCPVAGSKAAPRLDIKAGSHDLVVSGTKGGKVTRAAGLVNVTVQP